jgi:superfamily I DNA and/or RNA helicase
MRNHFLETSRGAALPRGAQDQFRGISVCIMDEASQCVEPEALIPLKFGFNKVIYILGASGIETRILK